VREVRTSLMVLAGAEPEAKIVRFFVELNIGPWEAEPRIELLDGVAPTLQWRPHRDSNPGFGLERATS
jgi:hypothetical protein